MLASLFRSTQDVLWGEALGFKEKEDAVLEVFFCYDPAPEGSSLYRKKISGSMDSQMWPAFCPLALGKVGRTCDLERESQSRACLGALSSQSSQDSP